MKPLAFTEIGYTTLAGLCVILMNILPVKPIKKISVPVGSGKAGLNPKPF
jgi:hypothetical protein